MSSIKDVEEYARSLAHYFPLGKLWIAKTIEDTNSAEGSVFWRLVLGLSDTLRDIDINIENLLTQFFPQDTTDFIEEWEAVVGIPDGCLQVSNDITTRRINILGKLSSLGAVTPDQWKNIANVMGLEIEIEYLNDVANFPFTFPFIFGSTTEENRFIVIIKFVGESPVSGFPFIFPFIFEDNITNNFKCILNNIKPAYIELVYM